MRVKSRDLLVWKYSECVSCSKRNVCPRSVANIRLCCTEDIEDADTGSIDYLIKRVIRYATAKRDKSRYFEHMVKPSRPTIVPRRPEAVLYCADLNEFTGCRPST